MLVTGGANGIGLAIARSFLKAGCKVAVFDIDKEAGEKLAHDEGARFYHTDITDPAKIEDAFTNLLKAWRDIDIIISNAGISTFSPLTEETVAGFDKVINSTCARLSSLHASGRHIASLTPSHPTSADA